MTHEEMLNELGLTNKQLKDLLRKHDDFMKSLDPAQRAVIQSSMPTLAQAAASFGPGASEDDVKSLLSQAAPLGATIAGNVAKGHGNCN